MMRTAAVLLLAAGANANAGFYLPGMEQREYSAGETVGPIDVNSLTSVHGVIPYDFYSLKFCRPTKDLIEQRLSEEKLGEVMWGDRIEPSLYLTEMMQDTKCRVLACEEANRQMNLQDLKLFERRINGGYRGNLILDNLPVVSNATWVMNRQCPSGKEIMDLQLRGFPLGVSAACLSHKDATEGVCHINNHLSFTIQVNEVKPDRFIIVGFYVVPSSIDHVDVSACGESFVEDGNHPPVTTELAVGQSTKRVIWSYSVHWERQPHIFWATRWDAYLNSSFANSNARVHWLSIINSLLVVLCLVAIVSMILMRTLHMDFNRYNNPEHEDEMQEEVGWKLVHADVFRTPSCVQVFCCLLGNGLQLCVMCGLSLVFALLGFLSPANRGGLLTALILLYVLTAVFNGYMVAVLQMLFQAKTWKTVFAAGLVYPGIIFTMWGVTEIFLRAKGAANAVPVAAFFTITGLWFGISVPLVILGASFGYKRPPLEHPVKVQRLARQIPPQKWFLRTPVLLVLPGLVPFGAAFIELRFILSSIWQGMVYYVFGFLTLVTLITIVTVCLTTVVIVYYTLVFEDYRWWWRSVTVPAGIGIHFFLYSWYYYITTLRVRTWLATALFFEFTLAVASMISMALGFVGFVSAWLFVRVIYTSIKVE